MHRKILLSGCNRRRIRDECRSRLSIRKNLIGKVLLIALLTFGMIRTTDGSSSRGCLPRYAAITPRIRSASFRSIFPNWSLDALKIPSRRSNRISHWLHHSGVTTISPHSAGMSSASLGMSLTMRLRDYSSTLAATSAHRCHAGCRCQICRMPQTAVYTRAVGGVSILQRWSGRLSRSCRL